MSDVWHLWGLITGDIIHWWLLYIDILLPFIAFVPIWMFCRYKKKKKGKIRRKPAIWKYHPEDLNYYKINLKHSNPDHLINMFNKYQEIGVSEDLLRRYIEMI